MSISRYLVDLNEEESKELKLNKTRFIENMSDEKIKTLQCSKKRFDIIMTDDEIKMAYELARDGYDNIAISKALGVSPRAFQGYYKHIPELYANYKKGKQELLKTLENRLMKFVNDESNSQPVLTAVIFYLKTQFGWTDRVRDNINLKDIDIGNIRNAEDIPVLTNKLISKLLASDTLTNVDVINVLKIVQDINLTNKIGEGETILDKLTKEQRLTLLGWVKDKSPLDSFDDICGVEEIEA